MAVCKDRRALANRRARVRHDGAQGSLCRQPRALLPWKYVVAGFMHAWAGAVGKRCRRCALPPP